jgi:hypothetical protein
MINKEFLLSNHADIVEMFRAEGRSAGLTTGRQEGAAAELARIQGVFAQAMPGHGPLVQQLAFDGKTTPGEAAIAINAAERAKLGQKAEDIAADAAAAAAAAPSASGDPAAAPAPAADANKPIEERAKAKWDADAKVRAEFGADFNAFLAFEKASEAGRVRILGKTKAA